MPGPFTTAQAAADDLSEAALRSSALRREHHGVYVDARLEPSVALSVAAARLVLPADAVLVECTAAGDWLVRLGRTDPRQWNVDIRRHEQLTADGCPVVRVTAQRIPSAR